MNPDNFPFCIDSQHNSVQIPLYFNQTRPKHVELLRIDLDTNTNETIVLAARDVNKARRAEDDNLLAIDFIAKKTGIYRLHKVVDRTKLEVQRRMSDTLVVACPKAVVKSSSPDKCVNDLSDLTMEIEGTPPLKVVYSRTSNREQSVHHFQSIQPENFASPLIGSTGAGILVPAGGNQDVSWARSHRISVPLNESLHPSGHWLYSIEEIHDAVGNVANFSSRGEDGEHVYPKGAHLEQALNVHERPAVRLDGHDSRHPMNVAIGSTAKLPYRFEVPNRAPDDVSHTVTWKFSPLDTLTKTGDHGDEVTFEEHYTAPSRGYPSIREPGLYTLTGVTGKFCKGEVKEPTSFLLLNPPRPELSISAENINDKCAGNSIGLTVDLDLIGTPPFIVRYDEITKTGSTSKSVRVAGLRQQLELKPSYAGHFKYQFTSIDDKVYTAQPLKGLFLEQDVKPPASAELRKPPKPIDACIEEPIELNVDLTGEQPFALEYELVHDGKRKKTRVPNIESDVFRISTEPLLKGGEYSLALTSVQDKTGCKLFLNSEVKFSVRRQRPRAAFGQLDGKYTRSETEGNIVGLPLRLTGQAPWTIKYTNLNDTSGRELTREFKGENDKVAVKEKGIWKILEVTDDQCPGTVDSAASTFEVDWRPRPQIKLADTTAVIPEGKKFVKREVCEGDIDSVEVNLIGMLTP